MSSHDDVEPELDQRAMNRLTRLALARLMGLTLFALWLIAACLGRDPQWYTFAAGCFFVGLSYLEEYAWVLRLNSRR